MKKYLHIQTQSEWIIISQSEKTIVLECSNPGISEYMYIGQRVKTSPACLATFYSEIL